MPLNTSGGFAGGAASGLQAGLGLGTGLFDQAAQRDIQNRELGLREQEFDLNKSTTERTQGRLDREEQRQNIETRLKFLGEHLDQLRDAGAGAAQKYGLDSPQAENYRRQINDAQAEISKQGMRLMAPKVYDGITQAMQDASDLEQGKAMPADLGPMRFSNVIGLTGHPAVDYLNNHDHDGDGVAEEHGPVSQAVQDTHAAAQKGNWQGVHEAAAPLMMPHTSMHPEGHESYFSGFNLPTPQLPQSPDTGMGVQPSPTTPVIQTGLVSSMQQGVDENGVPPLPNASAFTPHPHATPMAQTADVVGRKGVLVAAINSDPTARTLTQQGDQMGATANFNNALQFYYETGGWKQIPKYMEPDEMDRRYANYRDELIDGGMSPEKAKQKAHDETFIPQVVVERMRAQSEAPLHQSEIRRNDSEVARNNAFAARQKTMGNNLLFSNDGTAYHLNDEGTGYVDENGTPPAPGTQLTRVGVAGKGGHPETKFVVGLDPKQPLQAIPATVYPDGSWSRAPERSAEAPGQPGQPGRLSSSKGNAASSAPPLDDWMKAARAHNPNVSDADLRAYYEETYGNR